MNKPFLLTLIKVLFGIILLVWGFLGSDASFNFDAPKRLIISTSRFFKPEAKVFVDFFIIAVLTPLFFLLPEKKDLSIRFITVGFTLLFFFKLPFIAISGCLFIAGGIFLLAKTSS